MLSRLNTSFRHLLSAPTGRDAWKAPAFLAGFLFVTCFTLEAAQFTWDLLTS